ncbi:MAG: histidinol-phosphate transaminase, partial [Gemmatimonadetes bacterium]|nr:histidinol-phosphate transaminase [Gemmatimonadota bacterium]
CVDLKGRSGRELFQRLLPKGVILRPVDNYGLPGHIRVTLGTERENTIALAALGEVLAAG